MPRIVVQYLEEAQRSRPAPIPSTATIGHGTNSNSTAETMAATVFAARKLKVDLRAKFGRCKRKRQGK